MNKELKCEFVCACHKGMLGSQEYGNDCGLCGCSVTPTDDWEKFETLSIENGELEVGRNSWIASDYFMGQSLPKFIRLEKEKSRTEVIKEIIGVVEEIKGCPERLDKEVMIKMYKTFENINGIEQAFLFQDVFTLFADIFLSKLNELLPKKI